MQSFNLNQIFILLETLNYILVIYFGPKKISFEKIIQKEANISVIINCFAIFTLKYKLKRDPDIQKAVRPRSKYVL